MRRPTRTKPIACLILAATLLASCAGMTDESRNQLLGALGGAAAGAGIGALATRGDPKAALMGAAAGAAVGWAAVKLTQYYSQKTRSETEEAKAYGYQPAQGTIVKIRDASAAPQQLAPGQKVTFTTDYSVLAPEGTSSVAVQESWELSKDGTLIATMPPRQEQREPAGWQSRASIDIPSNAEPGTYTVRTRVAAGTSYDERLATFVVG
jgi:hypothetical protein